MGRAPSSASFLSISHTSCLRLSVSVSKKLCTAGAPVTTFSVAACTLARSPIVAANRRLQPFRYLHDCSDCFRLERIAGWGLHPLESAALSRRTWKPVIPHPPRHQLRIQEFRGCDESRSLKRNEPFDPLRTFGPARSLLQCPDFPELPVEAVRAGPDIFAALECSHFR